MFARTAATFCLLCVSSLPVLAKSDRAQSGEVSVYLRGEFETSSSLRAAFTIEVNRLMATLGYRVNWPYHANNVPGTLILVTAEGSCSTASEASVSPEGKALASTQEVNGNILPFVWLKCAELNALLAPELRANRGGQEERYGRALARVLAHEMFHILAQTSHHAESGVAQRAVTARNLLGRQFEFDDEAHAILRRAAANAGVTGF